MKKRFTGTGIKIVDNLYVQAEKVFRTCHHASLETRRRYICTVKRFLKTMVAFKLQKIQNIKHKHIVFYIEGLKEAGRSAKYIKTELSAIAFFLNHIIGLKETPPDPGELTKMFNLASTPDGRCDRAWTHEELIRFIEIAKKDGRYAFANLAEFIWYTGSRLDECVSLRRKDLLRARKSSLLILRNTKGGHPRGILLKKEALPFFDELIKKAPVGGYAITPHQYMGRLHEFKASAEVYLRNVRNKIQSLDRNETAHCVGKDQRAALTYHGIRHAYANNMYLELTQNGTGKINALRCVSEALGHHRWRISKIYVSSKNLL